MLPERLRPHQNINCRVTAGKKSRCSSRISNAFYGWRVFDFGDRVVHETNSCLQRPHKI